MDQNLNSGERRIRFATNTVTVNSPTAYRKGEYFRKELAVGNGSASLWTNIIVAATGQTSVTGNVFVAKAPKAFTYDADGNLTSDARWANRWDLARETTPHTWMQQNQAIAGSRRMTRPCGFMSLAKENRLIAML